MGRPPKSCIKDSWARLSILWHFVSPWVVSPRKMATKSNYLISAEFKSLQGGNSPPPVIVQSLRPVWFFVTPWTAAHQASLSFTISWSLLRLMSIQLLILSNYFILCHPLLLLPSIFPSIRVFSNHQVAKVLELQLQHQSFQWIFRVDFL